MNYIGLSTGFHDAAVSVVDNQGNILFAAHSERYSKNKHDKHLCHEIIKDAIKHTTGICEVHYYERPLMKFLRQLRSGEKPPLSNLSVKEIIGPGLLHLLQDGHGGKIHTHNHHLSHAAAGFQTSPYNDATVVVIDAIGEFDTISIWDATYNKNGNATYKKLWGKTYPDSIGLYYSAMKKRVG
jgi:carbamoyltransferase